MKMSYRLIIALCLTGTALSLPARAEEVPAAAEALLSMMERAYSVKPTYDSIEESDDGDITIANLKFEKLEVDGAPAMKAEIAEISMTDVADAEDGIIEVGQASFSGMSVDIQGPGMAIQVMLPEGTAEGWYLKEIADGASAEDQFRAAMNVARKMSGGKMTVTAMGQTYTVDGYESVWDGDPKTGAGKFSMKVHNIAVPEAALAMVDKGGMLKQLGYSGLSFDISSEGQMDVANGNLGIDMTMGITGKDIGTFRFSAAASDVPLAVYAELQNAQKSGKEPDLGALMPQLQAITFKSAALRFEDSSLTKRLLPMLAQMQGVDEATLISNAGAMMQVGLMQLQNPEFSAKVTAAVSSFLQQPTSITVAVKPSAPLKVQELMALNPAASSSHMIPTSMYAVCLKPAPSRPCTSKANPSRFRSIGSSGRNRVPFSSPHAALKAWPWPNA